MIFHGLAERAVLPKLPAVTKLGMFKRLLIRHTAFREV
jgi:hypothetical protein